MNCNRCGQPLRPGEHHLDPERCVQVLKGELCSVRLALKIAENQARWLREPHAPRDPMPDP